MTGTVRGTVIKLALTDIEFAVMVSAVRLAEKKGVGYGTLLQRLEFVEEGVSQHLGRLAREIAGR